MLERIEKSKYASEFKDIFSNSLNPSNDATDEPLNPSNDATDEPVIISEETLLQLINYLDKKVYFIVFY